MNLFDDTQFDQQLTDFFDVELGAQLGRAETHFASHKSPRFRFHAWGWLVAGPAMAACLFLAGMTQLQTPTANTTSSTVALSTENPTPDTVVAMAGTKWKLIDAGTVVLADQTPARKIIRQQVTYGRYRDPKTGAVKEYAQPKEEVVLVEMTCY